MSDFSLVTPFSTSCTHNSRVLGALRQRPAAVHGPLPVLRVPVRSDFDAREIIEQNDRKLAQGGSGNSAENTKIADVDSGTSEGGGTETESDEKPASYVELGQFQPRSRLEQVTTAFLPEFPALRLKHVERVFALFLLACPRKKPVDFAFSVMAEPINDTRGVFVRFPSVHTAQWAKFAAARVFPKITAIFDEYLDTLAAAESPELAETASDSDLEAVARSIASILGNRSLYSRGSGRSGTEDLDAVMQYYKTYKVENSELVEVPKELKEIIVQDIIRFRAKVLTLEREVRKKEIEKERRKAKARLTSIFEGIRAAGGGEPGGNNTNTEIRENSDNNGIQDGTEVQNPLDLMTDAEYEAHVEEEARKQREQAYEAEYQALVHLEKTQKTALLDTLYASRHYENNLIENKLQYIDECKAIQDLDSTSGGTSGGTSGIGLRPKLKLYYTNRGEYLRLRNQEKTREEAMDEADRNAEKETAPVPVAIPGVGRGSHTGKPVEITTENLQKKTDLEAPKVSTGEPHQNVVVSSFSDADLAAVKDKIAGLVEEFLGIKEDLLIDFIYDFVLEHNLARGEDLAAELQETLDEDSRTVVDQLHAFIATL